MAKRVEMFLQCFATWLASLAILNHESLVAVFSTSKRWCPKLEGPCLCLVLDKKPMMLFGVEAPGCDSLESGLCFHKVLSSASRRSATSSSKFLDSSILPV